MKAFALRGRLILFLAASLAAPVQGALATPADATSAPAAIVSPAVYDLAAVEQPAPANARYQTGAYFYGNDCGGNSVPTARAQRTNAPGGVILNGLAGRQIAQVLNCDDRRNALSSYRDAFQGKVGQAYSWRNPNGGASGDYHRPAPLPGWRRVLHRLPRYRHRQPADHQQPGNGLPPARRQLAHAVAAPHAKTGAMQ